MDDGRAAQETTDRAAHGVIDRGRPLAASGHEHDGPFRRYPELDATGLARPGEKRAADGIPVDERATVGQRVRSHQAREDRKSTRLNSSHLVISYAVLCL